MDVNKEKERAMQKQLDEKNQEHRIRRLARRHGYAVRKSREWKHVPHSNNFGGYMLIESNRNFVVLGERFDVTLEDIEAFFSAPHERLTDFAWVCHKDRKMSDRERREKEEEEDKIEKGLKSLGLTSEGRDALIGTLRQRFFMTGEEYAVSFPHSPFNFPSADEWLAYMQQQKLPQ
jgi:hypothetical protein